MVQVLGPGLAASHLKTRPVRKEAGGAWGVIVQVGFQHAAQWGSAGKHEIPQSQESHRHSTVRLLVTKSKPAPGKRDQQWKEEAAASWRVGFNILAPISREYRAPPGQ